MNEYNHEITIAFATTLIVNYVSYIKVPEKRLVVGETTQYGESSEIIITFKLGGDVNVNNYRLFFFVLVILLVKLILSSIYLCVFDNKCL